MTAGECQIALGSATLPSIALLLKYGQQLISRNEWGDSLWVTLLVSFDSEGGSVQPLVIHSEHVEHDG